MTAERHDPRPDAGRRLFTGDVTDDDWSIDQTRPAAIPPSPEELATEIVRALPAAPRPHASRLLARTLSVQADSPLQIAPENEDRRALTITVLTDGARLNVSTHSRVRSSSLSYVAIPKVPLTLDEYTGEVWVCAEAAAGNVEFTWAETLA